MKVHEAIVDVFDREGVDDVFTLLSEELIGLFSYLEEEWDGDIQVYHARHEQGAAAMADGYARSTGGIAVCVVGRGPAIAQTGTSLISAQKGGSNTLYLVPEMPLYSRHDDKEFPQQSYLETMVGDVVSIRSPDTFHSTFRDAFRRLRADEGPIAVQIPWDLLEADADALDGADYAPSTAASSSGLGQTRLPPNDDLIEEAVDLYLDSDATKPPIILAGRGAVSADAKATLEELAERLNAFLATTIQARGYFSDHPFSIGYVGDLGPNMANQRLAESDYVLAVGCSLNRHTTDSGYLVRDEAKVVHVDTDPGSFEQFLPVDLPILGDARLAAEAILEEIERVNIDRSGEFWTDRTRQEIEEYSPMNDREFPDIEGTIDPRDLVETLDSVLPEERLVTHDAGAFLTWVLDGITVENPNDHVWVLDVASIGLGLGIGLGSAVTTEDRTCIMFAGDAGLTMALPELETAVRHDIPIIVVVLNDDGLGAEYHVAVNAGHSGDVAVIDSPDFAAVAESLGAEGYTVQSVDDIKAISDSIGKRPSGPIVVDCKVNREVKNRFYD